jgi:hypothetical protein
VRDNKINITIEITNPDLNITTDPFSNTSNLIPSRNIHPFPMNILDAFQATDGLSHLIPISNGNAIL